jgi:hypothetical protein
MQIKVKKWLPNLDEEILHRQNMGLRRLKVLLLFGSGWRWKGEWEWIKCLALIIKRSVAAAVDIVEVLLLFCCCWLLMRD